LRERAEYRFGVVLLLLLATFTFMMAAPTDAWSRPVLVLLQGATLVTALSASGVPRRLVRLALVVTVVAFVVTAATVPISGTTPSGFVALLSALLVALAPIAIVWSIVRRRVIDARSVLGALCVYVLVGMFWAFTFTAVGSFGSDPFFAQHVSPTSADYLFFAFVTLTTVGYGDLTASGNLGRALAVLDALLGQIYLVTVVALLVSQFGRGRSAPVSDTARS
jgi:hypothetical protein